MYKNHYALRSTLDKNEVNKLHQYINLNLN